MNIDGRQHLDIVVVPKFIQTKVILAYTLYSTGKTLTAGNPYFSCFECLARLIDS